MRLKSIDIQGFKSFPDRTLLEFDKGVTAIIGPNGSGKSNIADAMRWVLGEQSTRTLRGGKMEDVIFGGTQARHAQGVASVTLNIDNTDRILPCDADEVAVTRRLYRTGDSEYRINGTQVRLKDVNELFMDTGLGRDGYAIIGQGRVAEIVSARSGERREIFEEAAGISRYRYRKAEAERRLALAEENLLRLRDILSELESRVGPLAAQSEKAKQFLEYSGEKRGLEISLWVLTLGSLHEKIAALEDKLLLVGNDHAQAEAGVKKCEEDFNLATEQKQQYSAEIERVRSQMTENNAEAARMTSDEAVERNEIEHCLRDIAQAESAIETYGRSQEELESSIAAAKAECERLQALCADLARQSETKTEEVASQAQQLGALKSAGDNLRLKQSAAIEAINAAKIDAAAAVSILGESEHSLETMDETKQRLTDAANAAQREIDDCTALLASIADEVTSLQNSADGYILKRTAREQKRAELSDKTAALAKEIDAARQRAHVLGELDKNMEGYGASTRFVIREAQRGALTGVLGPVSSLIDTDAEYATAIETALGAAMQNIVVENEDVAKRAIALLKQKQAGRATFLPLTSVRGSTIDTSQAASLYGYIGLASELVTYDARYAQIVRSLLGRTVIAQDLDAAVVIAKKNGYRFRIVTLDGQVVNAGGSMTGGYTSRTAGIIGRKKEIEELLEKAKTTEQKKALLDEQLAAIDRDIASLTAELDAIDAQQKTLGEDRIRAEAQLERQQRDLETARQSLRHAEEEQKTLAERIAALREKSATSEELAQTLSAELDALQHELEENTAAVSTADSNAAVLRDAMQALETERMLAQKDLAQAQQERDRYSEAYTAGREQQGAQREQLTQLHAQIEAAQAHIAELSEQRRQLGEKNGELESKIAELNADSLQCERQCSELRAAEKEYAARRDTLYREVVRLGEQKSAAQSEQDSIVAKLYDEYELTRSAAEEAAEPIEDTAAANRRLAELRGKIKALGSVNVDAIDEYKEVAMRYETLKRQIADVEGSKAELGRLIGELTGQMCTIFKEKFAEIDNNFRRIFTELFEGGSASLSLTEPDNVLESGIEIAVHPPGKLIKNLASLSGGEQSFVAIAIFFAILCVNPAPFCLMDEIEAALDDVNVARFAAYLHRLTEKTQFITITHRRGTMEQADVLYGVTMQEEGVSKLLRLKVSEIENVLDTKKK